MYFNMPLIIGVKYLSPKAQKDCDMEEMFYLLVVVIFLVVEVRNVGGMRTFYRLNSP